MQPTTKDEEYYKGFHDGVVRPNGPVWGNALSWIVPICVNIVLFCGPIVYFRRKYAQSMGDIAKKAGGKGKDSNPFSSMMEMMNPMKSKDFRTEVKHTKFEDVIGIPEAKEDLKQYVDFLKDPSKFTRLGARLPKGCLLTGPPGTGKTLLARAVAGEADKPFFSCSGADFIEIFGGSGPKRVRELFAEAKKSAPCVIFIDEIDAIGSRNQGGRSMGGGGGGSSEENRTINQLLAELDGLSSKETIVVIAATNYPEAIDKALLREGRFDRKVNIPMPDKAARSDLFEFYLKRVITGDPECKPKVQVFKPRETDENGEPKENATDEKSDEPKKPIMELKTIETKVVEGVSNKEYAKILADRTPGVSPAQIATIVNEAALNSAMLDKEVIPLSILQESIDDVLIGKKHRQRMSDKSLKRTAYHEVGHCIMAWLNPLQKDVIKISIIPRGRAGGYTQQVQDEAMEPQTDEFLFSQLCVLMGGRVAERLFMDDISTGAMDDLQRATRLSLEKLLKYGMSKSIGQLAFKPNDKNDGRAWMTWSEGLHSTVEGEARDLVAAAYKHTETVLTQMKDKHEQLTKLLLEKKELNKQDIESVLGERPKKA
ncbi:ATP-dependent zinc metallopeptidase [Angomonas deanei]|uniref:ATPase family associated with various cellular activities (AAA)/Peptidase family M41, putative n=1 Tax=Angomonas deanei TaxID=59799 RepID=A0A7G2CBH4_9TRYP|nr:ATP-dependent zinc metallopeptidase [Angomonas deanei]CAD2216284.1 ATPase family associated with various cellular activities (AAA)/Peptidase family M41, putative [Angomonas deanei]|eukprot:EPY28087.1 ATP-dependent zinc metallopeptidase [Angomonas deanei]